MAQGLSKNRFKEAGKFGTPWVQTDNKKICCWNLSSIGKGGEMGGDGGSEDKEWNVLM